VALVGVGRWGRRWLDLLHRSSQVNLVWACDGAGASVLDGAPEVNFTRELDICLADPRVQAVVLSTPIETHAELALQALCWNKHVLVEKPVATDSASLQCLVAVARDRGRVLAVNHLLLHHPAVSRMAEQVRRGTLGRLVSAVSLRASQSDRVFDCPWWTLAPHDLSLVDSLAGGLLAPSVALEERGRELCATVSSAGFEARLHLSLCGARKLRLFALQGTLGTLVFDDLQPHPLCLHRGTPAELPLDERLLRGRLGFGEALRVPRVPALDAALEAFLTRVRHRDVPGRRDADEAHMRRVIATLECGRPFLPGAERMPLEVPA
jgi:predicted dehydrogenase